MFVSGFIEDDQVRQSAVSAAVRIALPTPGKEDGLYGDNVGKILSKAKEIITGPESPYIKIDIETYLKTMRYWFSGEVGTIISARSKSTGILR
jgi:hypothetical protein